MTFAIKSIRRKKVEENMDTLEQELDILLKVDHPNIVNFYEVYLDHKYVHLVMEYMPGGELYDKLLQIQIFDEETAKKIIKQTLYALKHLHDLNICHRDLKPENIMFDEQGSKVKLIDFGMSKILQDEANLMNTKLGTPYYISPEVLRGEYNIRCDMWSIGVICFVILCGEPPFHGKNTAELFKKIQTTDYEFEQDIWKTISKDAKSFIMSLLEPNLERRLSVEQALSHKWIVGIDGDDLDLDGHCALIFSRLKSFARPSRLQMEFLMMLVGLLDDEIIVDNKRAFHLIDSDHSGTVS